LFSVIVEEDFTNLCSLGSGLIRTTSLCPEEAFFIGGRCETPEIPQASPDLPLVRIFHFPIPQEEGFDNHSSGLPANAFNSFNGLVCIIECGGPQENTGVAGTLRGIALCAEAPEE